MLLDGLLHGGEEWAHTGDAAADVRPLALQALGEPRVGRLRVLPRDLREGLDGRHPPFHFWLDPPVAHRHRADEPADVAVPAGPVDAQPPRLERRLARRLVRQRADAPGLLRLGVVPKHRAHALQLDEAIRDVPRQTHRRQVVSKPRLEDLGVLRAEVPAQRQQADAVESHREGVALGHAFAAEQDQRVLAGAAAHQPALVAVAVEDEPRRLGPEVPHRPEHAKAAQHI